MEKSTNANSTGWKNQPMLIQQGGKINPNPREKFNLYRITGLTLRPRSSSSFHLNSKSEKNRPNLMDIRLHTSSSSQNVVVYESMQNFKLKCNSIIQFSNITKYILLYRNIKMKVRFILEKRRKN